MAPAVVGPVVVVVAIVADLIPIYRRSQRSSSGLKVFANSEGSLYLERFSGATMDGSGEDSVSRRARPRRQVAAGDSEQAPELMDKWIRNWQARRCSARGNLWPSGPAPAT